MNILVSMNEKLRAMFFSDDIYDSLKDIGNVTYNDTGKNYNQEELKEQLADKDVIITGWGHTKITPQIAGERLKLVVHTGGTLGPIIDSGLYDMGIKTVSANEIYAESVAEGVIAYILCELRKLNFHSKNTKNGIWTKNEDLGTRSLKGKTVGIVSLGRISTYLIKQLKPFGVNIKVYSTSPDDNKKKELGFEYGTLEEIFSNSDIVTVHTAANDETFHMINKNLLKLLKQGSLFINTSRGSVVDEEALIEQLKEHRFSAILDVYTKEPLSAQSELLNLDNVTLYPHMAGPASDLKHYITSEMVNEINRFKKEKHLRYEITKKIFMGMTQTT